MSVSIGDKTIIRLTDPWSLELKKKKKKLIKLKCMVGS